MTIPTPTQVDSMVIDLDGFATRADAAATALNSTADDLERWIDGMGWSGAGLN